MSAYRIRIVGDPVLRQTATEVEDIDAAFVRTTEEMAIAMYEAPGIGLAAPQVGIARRFFVYDHDQTGPKTLINPVVAESDGEWDYEEGCLSVPGLYFEITRPKTILVRGRDIDGNDVEIEADELFSRLIQHELDHLDGVLLLDHLEADQRKAAKKEIRKMMMGERGPDEVPERNRSIIGRLANR